MAAESLDRQPCPVPNAHRRLMDCHAHLHAALDEYMEPEGFRLNLNALIQALRNVTWVLQKQKKSLPGFDDWYPAWQQSVKGDEIMTWVVRARNRIVKESDLELHSTAKLTLTFDWANGDERVFVVPPRWGPRDIAGMLIQKGIPPGLDEGQSSLTISRQWVDRLLPEHELLAACTHAMGELTTVVRTAHVEAGIEGCDLAARSRECIDATLSFPLDCLWLGEDERTAHFDLATLAPYRSTIHRVHYDPDMAAVAVERYGDLSSSGDAIERVPQIMEMGKAALSADEYIITSAWLMRGDEVVDLQGPVFFDQAGKMLAMQNLARRAQMLNADGFVLLGEVWQAPAPSAAKMRTGDYTRPTDHPERTEAVHAIGLTKDGRFHSLLTPFTREGSRIVFGDPIAEVNPVFMMFRPILKLWGLEEPHSVARAVKDTEERERRDAGE